MNSQILSSLESSVTGEPSLVRRSAAFTLARSFRSRLARNGAPNLGGGRGPGAIPAGHEPGPDHGGTEGIAARFTAVHVMQSRLRRQDVILVQAIPKLGTCNIGKCICAEQTPM